MILDLRKRVNILKNKNKKSNSFTNKIKSHFSIKLVVFNLALLVFAVYAFATLINQQVQISLKTSELDSINQSIVVQQAENQEIKNVYNVLKELSENTKSDEYQRSLRYIEKIAREEYNYSSRGERIFINIAGD